MIRKTLLAAVLAAGLAATGAQAATYNLQGQTESGPLAGFSLAGVFSYDETQVSPVGEAWLNLTSFQASIFGNSYNLAASDATATAHFSDGQFLGLDVSYSAGQPQWSLQSGVTDFSEAAITYASPNGAGYGSYTVSAVVTAVPEPSAVLLALAGLGVLAAGRRRSNA